MLVSQSVILWNLEGLTTHLKTVSTLFYNRDELLHLASSNVKIQMLTTITNRSVPLFPLLEFPPYVIISNIYRPAHHLLAGVLRVPGGEEVVGAVLQAALARHHRHLPEGVGGGEDTGDEGDGKDGTKNCDPLLHAGLHPLHQAAVGQVDEEVPHHGRPG